MFIIDSSNQLIAAEATDLARWGFSDIYQAARAFRDGSLKLDRDRSRLAIPTGENLECAIESVESVLGSWYLCTSEAAETAVEPSTAEEKPAEQPAPAAPETEGEELLAILPLEEAEETPQEAIPPVSTETAPEENLEDEIEALLKATEEEEEPAISLMSPEEEAQASVGTPQEETITLPEEALPEVEHREEEKEGPIIPLPEAKTSPWEEIETEFNPDLSANAKRIELSEREYGDLLKEFIRDSRTMREQLLDPDEGKRKNAAAVLKDAVSLLHLSPLDRLLGMMEHASPDERNEIVNEYERLLGQLEVMLISLESTTAPETETTTLPESEETLPPREEPSLAPPLPEAETPQPAPEPAVEEPAAETEISITPERETPEAVTKVSVEEFVKGVTPIPIEFSLQIASQELNLPEDLVLEFINDFAKQGHEYLPVLIDAYHKKDLDHLQKTAHMLKGAASNLRIEAMVDNLYDLQFDNDIERAPQRIRLFAGQLMSLDNYLKQMNQ